jgi:hypothetical protein
LSRLCHLLVDAPSKPQAFWLLTRVADFLLKVYNGEWDGYHPLRQRFYFRQLANDLAAVRNDIAASVPPETLSECDASVRAFLKALQSARHFPGRFHGEEIVTSPAPTTTTPPPNPVHASPVLPA